MISTMYHLLTSHHWFMMATGANCGITQQVIDLFTGILVVNFDTTDN